MTEEWPPRILWKNVRNQALQIAGEVDHQDIEVRELARHVADLARLVALLANAEDARRDQEVDDSSAYDNLG